MLKEPQGVRAGGGLRCVLPALLMSRSASQAKNVSISTGRKRMANITKQREGVEATDLIPAGSSVRLA